MSQEFIEIGVRVRLEKLKVVTPDDDEIGGNADEPFLWVAFLKADGSTVTLAPPTGHVEIHAPPGAHHNLGSASEGVWPGQTIDIPASIGTWETKLRGFEAPLALTKLSMIVVAVVGLDHDSTSDMDAIELHRRVVKEVQKRLDAELQKAVSDAYTAITTGGPVPSGSDVEAALRAQLSEQVLRDLIDEFVSERLPAAIVGSFFNPIKAIQSIESLANPDDLVGYGVTEPLNYSTLLARSGPGIPFKLKLTGHSKGRYVVTGFAERTDIREPPTLAIVRLSDNRKRVYARSTGKKVYVSERSAAGQWGYNMAVGAGPISSGPAVAASADGSKTFVFGRGMDHRIWMHRSGDGNMWRPLFSRKFLTGAGAACSSDGSIIFVAATGSDKYLYATFSVDGGDSWERDWYPLMSRSITSPALACSADGRVLHLVYVVPSFEFEERLRFARMTRLKYTFDPAKRELLPAGHDAGQPGPLSAAACACSADGRILYVAALSTNQQYWVQRLATHGPNDSIPQKFLRGKFVSAPALACSPDGTQVHICGIDQELALRHRYSTDGGSTYAKNWGYVRAPNATDNGAWF